jgi:hypothetical protein
LTQAGDKSSEAVSTIIERESAIYIISFDPYTNCIAMSSLDKLDEDQVQITSPANALKDIDLPTQPNGDPCDRYAKFDEEEYGEKE